MTGPSTQAFVAVVQDRYGFVMKPEWIAEHLTEDHDECDECPSEGHVVTGEAMPSEPDEHGLNSRMPNPRSLNDTWVTYDFACEDVDWIAERIEKLQQIAAALNTVGKAGSPRGDS